MTSIKRHADTLVAGSRNGLRTGGCSTSCSAAKVQGGEVKKVQEGESRALPAESPDSERLFLSELRAASLVSALDSLALRFQRLSSGNSMQTVQRGRLQMLERPSGTNWQVFFFFFFSSTHPVASRTPAQTHGHTQLRKHTDARIDTSKHFVAFSFYVICQRNTGQDGVSRSLLIQSIQKNINFN